MARKPEKKKKPRKKDGPRGDCDTGPGVEEHPPSADGSCLDDDPVSSADWNRIARKLWGDEVFDEKGHYYAESTDEVVAILQERIRELEARLAGRDPQGRARP